MLLPSIKIYFKRKRRSGTNLPVSFSAWLRNILFTLYSINWPSLIVCLLLLLKISGNVCIIIICCPIYDVINFEMNLNHQNLNIPRKSHFKVKRKAFFIIFEGFSVLRKYFKCTSDTSACPVPKCPKCHSSAQVLKCLNASSAIQMNNCCDCFIV